MPERKREPEIEALEAIHAALKPLDDAQRRKVLASSFALLGIEAGDLVAARSSQSSFDTAASAAPKTNDQGARAHGRPLGISELIAEKLPGTNAQRITLFAYYRDKYEGSPRFGRNDLESYFANAKQSPPTNYDRDFVEAVKRGWIHEDGDDSFITSKGIEVVESGFVGERKYTKNTRKARKTHVVREASSPRRKASRKRPRK